METRCSMKPALRSGAAVGQVLGLGVWMAHGFIGAAGGLLFWSLIGAFLGAMAGCALWLAFSIWRML